MIAAGMLQLINLQAWGIDVLAATVMHQQSAVEAAFYSRPVCCLTIRFQSTELKTLSIQERIGDNKFARYNDFPVSNMISKH